MRRKCYTSYLAYLSVSFLWLAQSTFSLAHDEWANGQPVPAWVKSSCCGAADAHHLRVEQVHGPYGAGEGPKPGMRHSYYLIDGYPWPVGGDLAQPSQDGEYWLFYKEAAGVGYSADSPSGVYCFFVPMNF